MDSLPFEQALDVRIAEVLDRCTSCGACVDVCPMPAATGIDATDPRGLASGVLALLRGDEYPAASARWAAVCTGSGHCIPACQYTGVRVLSRLQLPPDLLARFRPERESNEKPEIAFYTGCNLLKTPHIALLCFDIMEALGIQYRVIGGPSHCCGVLQFRAGDLATSGRIAYRTVERLAGAGDRVLSWCPTCQVQLGEMVIPGKIDTKLELEPFLLFLASRLDDLRPLLRNPVRKRVGLHEHPGVAGVTDAARTILQAIPGLEFVDLEQPRIGWMCNTLNVVPEYKRQLHLNQLQAAADAGVTTLAGIYHACHRELCSHETDWPFEVVNFLELVGESIGFARPDLFKRLKLMQDVDAILSDTAPLIETNHIALDEARSVILADLLGE
jgi:heterodisulfide reductase subunit D